MATIEIGLEAYNNMVSNLEELQQQLNKDRKLIQEKDDLIEELSEDINTLKDAPILDRIFGWKRIIKLLNTNRNPNNV